MNDWVHVGSGKHMLPLPPIVWQRLLKAEATRARRAIQWMDEDAHRLREYLVREIPWQGSLASSTIAIDLNMNFDQVRTLLDEMEKRLFFLYRDRIGRVEWAYPVTDSVTPHRVLYPDGRDGYAACGIDAIATPFVQGHLTGHAMRITIETVCADCDEPVKFDLDTHLQFDLHQLESHPLIFVPIVDFSTLEDPSIIDAF